VEFLRQRGIEVAWEGTYSIVDNPVVAALLSLAKVAAHPGDSFALRHLEMTPLLSLLPGDEEEICLPELVLDVLDDVSGRGFEFLVRKWADRMDRAGLLTDFTRRRTEELAAVAGEFDLTGEKAVVEFIDFVSEYTMSDATSRRAVQVMTMHKSKGLEFDLVVLPDLEGQRGIVSSGQPGLEIRKADSVEREAKWVLAMPVRLAVSAEPVLSDFQELLDNDNCYEQLCLLYVGMTRAIRGLYMVATAQGRNSQALYLSTLLRERLSGTDSVPVEFEGCAGSLVYQWGDSEWYQDSQPSKEETVSPGETAAPPAVVAGPSSRRSRLERRTPSAIGQGPIGAGLLFSQTGRCAAELGTALHALFEHVEWSDDCDVEMIVRSFEQGGRAAEGPGRQAVAEFRLAMEMQSVQDALRRPSPLAEVWRERTFEIVVDESWVSGCFDRVVLVRDEQGRVVSAAVLDYKSNRIESDADLEHARRTYAPQMRLYRKVLSRMLDFPESRIVLHLLFTNTGQIEQIS